MLACQIGRNGIAAIKREGDGCTPLASLRLLSGYQRRDRMHLCLRKLAPAAKGLGWCDQPQSPLYNRPVRLPFAASHEEMARSDGLYDICMVLDWNMAPRARFRGSAIFLHVSREDRGPTQGCIALPLNVLARLMEKNLASLTIKVIA
ncbi:MAG: L,D-transpeptidase family protein [Rhizobiaceae bacterium]